MATSEQFIQYVCEQLKGIGNVYFKKMFGEYMVYVNDKPIVIVCDGTAFVKKLDCIQTLMEGAFLGYPYKGAKEHYILDIDDSVFSKRIVSMIEASTLAPKKKTRMESRCGICCSKCQFLKDKICQGCTKITKPFWGDVCPVKACAEEKKVECCGKCFKFPCDLLHSFAYDEKQGDNGARIENCRKWCSKD